MPSTSIDFSLFTNGSLEARRETAQEVYGRLRSHGFVKLRNHGMTEANVANIFDQSRSFFHLPEHIKHTVLHVSGPTPQRGWSRVGDENTSSLYRKGLLGEDVPGDLKEYREHFDMAALSHKEFPNRFPAENVLPGFRNFMGETFSSMHAICDQVLEALELAMELTPGLLRNMCSTDDSASELRTTWYPSVLKTSLETGKASRIWPHFDLGVITLLFQDSVGGLEFEDRGDDATGKFKAVACDQPSDMIVNVSETLQRWTNGQLPAGLHRVVAPPSYGADDEKTMLPERFSVAYFCKADRNVSVGPLEAFLTGQDAKYESITALQYHQQRLVSAVY